MPDYQFTFTVPNITAQRATAIRDRIAQRLGEESVEVTALAMARTTETYRVIGVDTADSTVFDETVEAADRQSARDQVVGSSSTMVVAMVHES